MDWKEVAQWLWVVAISVIAYMLKSEHDDMKDLSKKVHDIDLSKVDKDDLRSLQQKTREDVIALHAKIDAGQKETRDRLDKILDKVSR